MSEGAEGTPQAEQGQQGATTTDGQDQGKTFTQEDVNRFLAAERRDQEQRFAGAVEKAAKFDDLEEQSKSELQKAQERAERLDQELAAERSGRLRLEVATAKGLPPELAARLQGGTKEELEADADALISLLPKQQESNSFRDAQGSQRDPEVGGDWLRNQFAR